jgi:RNA polymerase sigma-70 factor (ECF subfamily)
MAAPAVDEDEALAARAAAGEEPAFEELVARYQSRVYRLACRLSGSEGHAKDVLQETFLAVHRGIRAFRAESRFSTPTSCLSCAHSQRCPRPTPSPARSPFR